MHQLLLLPAWVFIGWFLYVIWWENKHLDPDYPENTEPPKTLLDLEND